MNSPLTRTIDSVVSPADPTLEAQILRRLDSLTKPPGSLGRLEDAAFQYARARGELLPAAVRARMYVFCADHGVTAEGVSAFPSEVTRQMVLNFASGGAAINVLCRTFGIEPTIVDVGTATDFDQGLAIVRAKVRAETRNFAIEPAMTRGEVEQAFGVGIEQASKGVAAGATLLAAGEMGIGNTTAAAAVGAVLLGCPAEQIVGIGTGIDEEQRRRKVAVTAKALEDRRPDRADPLDVLAKVGGLEIAAMSGFYLGSASARTPAVVDGFIATAAALAAIRLAPAVRDYLIWGHRSAEQGHRLLLEGLDAKPLLELEMRLGEGTGAALACGLVEAAVRVYLEMATFESAGVSGAG